MSDVDAPWKVGVDIEEWSERDFQRRSDSLSVYDSTGSTLAVADIMADMFGMTPSAVMDRSIRIYLAHIIDTTDELDGFREEHGVRVMIPPEGWVEENLNLETRQDVTEADLEWATEGEGGYSGFDIGNRHGDGDQYVISTTVAVAEMVGSLAERGIVESKSQFIRDAVAFYAAEN